MNALPKKEDLVRYSGKLGGSGYLAIPREAMTWGLTLSEVVVYSLLLDRASLSRKNGRKDENGDPYANYSLTHLAGDMNVSVSTVRRSIRELEKRGLLQRRTEGGRAVRHFPMVPPAWKSEKGKTAQPAPVMMDLGDLDWALEEMEREKTGQAEQGACSH